MENIELLAPAGCKENFLIAIKNGANAVYLGLQDFNARMSADNFTSENIAEFVRLAHSYGVKVYVTVNTLISNDEVPKMIETVKSAVEAKVDAFLVQDLGVLSILKKCFKGICLHASTQMGVHNLKGAKILESLGVKRVVLSREIKLEDIKEIKKNTNLELEYFVHGALCIAFSGNCYFSGMALGDSGNRGRCKQFCRMKYKTNMSDEEKYLLSARDLCLMDSIKELIDAGICSFKIEGRLRNAGYVYETTKTYRKVLDALNNNEKINLDEEKENLKKVFNRGDFLNRAYLDPGVPDDVVNSKTQNHLGVEIGKVIKTEKFKELERVTIFSTHKLKSGDGLKFFDDGKEMASLGVGNVDELGSNLYRIYTKHKLNKDYVVNLILDSEIEEKARKSERKIKFSAKIFANSQKPLSCVLKTEEAQIEFCDDTILEKAKNLPQTKEDIKAQFSKLGDTDFEMAKCEVETDGVFIAKSVLNNFRRNAIQKLLDEIIKYNEKDINVSIDKNFIQNLKIEETSFDLPFKNICVVSEDEIDYLTNMENTLVVLSPTTYSIQNIENLLSKVKTKYVGIELPIIANTKDEKILDEILKSHKELFVLSNNLYGLSYTKTHKVLAGYGMNVFNNYTISFLKELGVSGVVISVEQQKDKIQNLNNYFVYSVGFLPLMTFAHCPYKTNFKNSCKNCSYKKGLEYVSVNNNAYKIERYILSQCYFRLLNSHLINNLGYGYDKQFLVLKNLNESQIKLVFESLKNNKKISLSNKDIFGRLQNSVK